LEVSAQALPVFVPGIEQLWVEKFKCIIYTIQQFNSPLSHEIRFGGEILPENLLAIDFHYCKKSSTCGKKIFEKKKQNATCPPNFHKF
jgi:hypothetical protein